MSTASAANLLAAAAATSRFVEAARPVRATYRDFVLDTIAVMAAGAAHPSLAPVRTAFMATESVGRCSAVGFAERCPASVAGLVNGAAMTVLLRWTPLSGQETGRLKRESRRFQRPSRSGGVIQT